MNRNREKRSFKLRQDWVFKTVYGSDTRESRDALKAFLNVVLDRKDDPISEVTIKNPVILRDVDELKEVVLDIKAFTDSDEMLDIEMQTYGLDKYPYRALFNGGKMISTSLEKGNDYDKMKPSIVISVIDGVVFEDIPKEHTVFKVCEIDTGDVMADKAEWHFLELGKLSDDLDPDEMSEEQLLMAYLKYSGEEDRDDYLEKLIRRQLEVIDMSEKVIQDISEETLALWRQFSLERQERDILSLKNMMLKQGLEQGLEQGKYDKAVEVAKKLLDKGMDMETISDITGLEIREIEKI